MIPMQEICNKQIEKIELLEKHMIRQTVQYQLLITEIKGINQKIFWFFSSLFFLLVSWLLYEKTGLGG